ncbi:hypothetical protein FB451DRAFT_1231963 [Mycena latifolia]|nr:hypothetical protein FB451DRAFT_1231963 [Mycena latifolia]
MTTPGVISMATMTDTDWEAERRDEQRFARLTSTLQDPMGPGSYCAHQLTIAVCAWHAHGEIAAKDPTRAVLLRSVAHFLMAPRTQQDRAAIKARLLTCACDGEGNPADQELTILRETETPPSFYYEKAMVVISHILFAALAPLCAGQFRKRKKNVRRTAQPWPLDFDDLFPGSHGYEGAVRSLLGWAENGPGGYGPFIAIAALVTYWEPFGREILRQPAVLASAARKLRLGYESYVKTNNPRDPFFTWPLLACAERFLHSLRRFPPAEGLTAMLPSYEELHFVSARINPILGASFPKARYWFDALIEFSPVYALVCKNPNMVIRLEGTEGHDAAFESMTQIRNDNRCMNVHCTSPLGTRTSACARCAVVRYCSKPCQRLAWQAAVAPHRILCKSIHTLRGKLGLLDAAQWDSWMLNDTPNKSEEHNWRNFEPLCQTMNVELALSESIESEIKALEASRNRPILADERFRW